MMCHSPSSLLYVIRAMKIAKLCQTWDHTISLDPSALPHMHRVSIFIENCVRWEGIRGHWTLAPGDYNMWTELQGIQDLSGIRGHYKLWSTIWGQRANDHWIGTNKHQATGEQQVVYYSYRYNYYQVNGQWCIVRGGHWSRPRQHWSRAGEHHMRTVDHQPLDSSWQLKTTGWQQVVNYSYDYNYSLQLQQQPKMCSEKWTLIQAQTTFVRMARMWSFFNHYQISNGGGHFLYSPLVDTFKLLRMKHAKKYAAVLHHGTCLGTVVFTSLDLLSIAIMCGVIISTSSSLSSLGKFAFSACLQQNSSKTHLSRF